MGAVTLVCIIIGLLLIRVDVELEIVEKKGELSWINKEDLP